MLETLMTEIASKIDNPLIEEAKGIEKITDSKELDKPITDYVSDKNDSDKYETGLSAMHQNIDEGKRELNESQDEEDSVNDKDDDNAKDNCGIDQKQEHGENASNSEENDGNNEGDNELKDEENHLSDLEKDSGTEQVENIDLTKQYKPNSAIECNGHTYETDDKGNIYKIDNIELLPNSEYTLDGMTYKTDEKGRIISCEGELKLTPEGERDSEAQRLAGGTDRKEGDQGGHIIARVLGGAKGIENLLAMRGVVNQRLYYHKMEKPIIEALKEGNKVSIHVDVLYEGDSKRPSIIKVTYSIDGQKFVMEYDNKEGSTELIKSLSEKVDQENINDLKQEIEDANKDGANICIVAVKTEYNDDGSPKKITVIMIDENKESPGNKEERVFQPKKEGEK